MSTELFEGEKNKVKGIKLKKILGKNKSGNLEISSNPKNSEEMSIRLI